MERKLTGRGIGGGGREEISRGRKTSAKGQHGNGWIGSEGMKRLGAGGRVSGGWLRQGGSNASGLKKGCLQFVWTSKLASGRIGPGPLTSGRNKPWSTHPEQEFTLQAPGTSGAQGERGQTERKVFFFLMWYTICSPSWGKPDLGCTPN